MTTYSWSMDMRMIYVTGKFANTRATINAVIKGNEIRQGIAARSGYHVRTSTLQGRQLFISQLQKSEFSFLSSVLLVTNASLLVEI